MARMDLGADKVAGLLVVGALGVLALLRTGFGGVRVGIGS